MSSRSSTYISVLPPEPESAIPSFTLVNPDSAGFTLRYTRGFEFPLHSAELGVLSDPGLVDLLLDLENYMVENPQKILVINGMFALDEKNGSPFADLGLARARVIRRLIQSLTDSLTDRLRIISKAGDSLVIRKGKIMHAIDFSFADRIQFSKEMDSIRRHYSRQPVRLPFLYEDSPMFIDEGPKKDFTALIECLELNPVLGCQIVGFTDSRGSASANFQFGRRRAEFVKKYIVSLGIDPERVQVMSRGERNPIAPNDTPEGKAANRRVEITLTRAKK